MSDAPVYDVAESPEQDVEILHSDFFFLPGKSIALVSVGEKLSSIKQFGRKL